VPAIALRRRITDHVMTGVAVLTVILVLVPLFAIFAYLVYRGVGSINWAFLTQTPKPVVKRAEGWRMRLWAPDSFWLWRVFWEFRWGWEPYLSGGVWPEPPG